MKPNQDPNPNFPLPADYFELTSAGQKEARLSVLMDQSTPDKLVQAWDLFRRFYLVPMGNAFYKSGFQESPPIHYEMVRDLGRYARNAEAAPRGFAKSTVIGCEIPLLLALTRPYFPIALGLSTDALVEARFDRIMEQFTTNELILEDFGEMKPRRGDAIWNRHHLHLKNGATIQGFSVMGRKRGARPQLFILDDPENDPSSDSQTSQQLLLEKFEGILFRQIIPMLEQGAAIFWIGTLINRRSFLYHATCMQDSRFEYWNRRVCKAIEYDMKTPSHTKVLWPEKWPQEVLEVRRAEIGNAAFNAEYLNDPISDTERLFVVHPRRNEYTVDAPQDDPYYQNEPLRSTAPMIWYKRQAETDSYIEKKEPFGEFVKKLFRIVAVDYAVGLGQFNDYSCGAVMGFDTHNTLWVLDMWMGRVKESVLTRQIYNLARKWMVKAIGIEAISMQVWFVEAMQAYVEEHPDLWAPRVIPVRYPSNSPKQARIAGLEPRFQQGLIKYPAHLAEKWPFSMLYSQTRDFTYDLALLPFDDAIDTVAMSQYIVHSRGVHSIHEPNKEKSRLQRIKEGQPPVPGAKLPIVSGAELDSLTDEEWMALLDRHYKKTYNEQRRKGKHYYDISRPNVIG